MTNGAGIGVLYVLAGWFRLGRRVGVVVLVMVSPVRATNLVNVMTFNLRYASAADGDNNWINSAQAPERRQVAIRVIQNHDPDIIGFQEGEDAQLDDLLAALPGYAFERRKPSGGGGNENAAFVWKTNRLDLVDRGLFSLGPAPGGGYWNNHPSTNFNPYVYFPDMGLNFPRLALWGRFVWKATGQEFLFYTTHFDFNDTPQVRSAHLIVDDAYNRNDRMPASPLAIVVGDFNSTHQNNSWKFFTGSFYTNGITGDFTDSWQAVNGNWNNSGTIHGFNGGIRTEQDRIDWILHRGGFTSATVQIVYDAALATNLNNGATRWQYPSDHYPVRVELILPPVKPDIDRDGLPDSAELSQTGTSAVDADTDDDQLIDGQEDLNANGVHDGGETNARIPNDVAQLPTDIRNYQMNGIRDYKTALLAQNGLELWAAFDGRYLYVATHDSGEGSDHFIFISTNPSAAVSAPWAKSGLVGRWVAYLADENDGAFNGWFDASGTMITNVFTARSATYYQNGGRLEGVIDLASFLGAGFTSTIYLAAAPYGTLDGGALVSAAQVPVGNDDGNLLGDIEYFKWDPGDDDGDGINNYADPDRDGNGIPDAWESAYGILNPENRDSDGDGSDNWHEFLACTDPVDPASVFALQSSGEHAFSWRVPYGKTSTVWRLPGVHFNPDGLWSLVDVVTNTTSFPVLITNRMFTPDSQYFRLRQ